PRSRRRERVGSLRRGDRSRALNAVPRRSRWSKPIVFALFAMTWLNAAAILLWRPPRWIDPACGVWASLATGMAMGASLYFIALRRVALPFARASRLPFAR